MQYLKEEIRDRIVQSAMTQFIKNGYMSTSMRKIADEAGIVSGNIYRYYKNKEDLFISIVHPVIIIFDELETKIKPELMLQCEVKNGEPLVKAVNRVTEYLFGLFKGRYKELLLVLDCSEGTNCSGLGKSLENVISQAIHKIYDDNIVNRTEEYEFIIKLVIISYISCLHYILNEDCENSESHYKKFNEILELVFKYLNGYIEQ